MRLIDEIKEKVLSIFDSVVPSSPSGIMLKVALNDLYVDLELLDLYEISPASAMPGYIEPGIVRRQLLCPVGDN